ncbi:F-box/LRR-repeat protein At3g48880-like isoform X3 [Quercus robur]|uniref:F-box/LRR-repeat protein At3g48880-like isoform X3 n=1 Tax=Quercus robur TaxID=38942 RepID=UPI002162C625|nr:F-box/LRR-repeat protein At3g48880-like isoform X3 [Quercus robur]
MSGPKWEDLNMDCLVNVLTRVGIESLLLGAPFVCQSWYKASLHPSCWQIINFQKIESGPLSWYFYDGITTEFIKSIINRSRGNATEVWLPDDCSEEALIYIADECPALKALYLSDILCYRDFMVILPELISKWKNLELLRLGSLSNMEEVFEEINCHCKNFYWLCASGADIERDTASAIVTFLPKITHLYMRNANIDRESLEMILQGCEELVLLDARDCVGYECDDQLLKLASHISNFQHEGSSLFDDEDDPIDHIYDPAFDGILSE